MLGTKYPNEDCSAARALEVAGERWSLLILRDALFRGATQFSDFERNLGIASNILAKRLEAFVADGLFEYRKSEPGAAGGRYLATEKARDFKPVIMALTAWGDRWAAPDGPPVVFRHGGCGGKLDINLSCSTCQCIADLDEVVAMPRTSTD
jgi:DNA-binding HxlR family transcriptional regulator